MSQHTVPFTMPTQAQVMDVKYRIQRDLHQLRGTSYHQSNLLVLFRLLDWDATDDYTITQNVQTIQESLYSLIATSIFDDHDSGKELTPSRDFRRLEAKLRVSRNLTPTERATIDIVRLYDDVMFILGLPVS